LAPPRPAGLPAERRTGEARKLGGRRLELSQARPARLPARADPRGPCRPTGSKEIPVLVGYERGLFTWSSWFLGRRVWPPWLRRHRAGDRHCRGRRARGGELRARTAAVVAPACCSGATMELMAGYRR